MYETALVEDTLVCVTTYAGGFETRHILSKVLRHFRSRNGKIVPLVVISDGFVHSKEVMRLADVVDQRPGPSGLQDGELESLHRMLNHARAHNVRTVVKICGDVIMDTPDWVRRVVEFQRSKDRPMLSTHWFRHDSGVVGTKFFVADVDFLSRVLPPKLDDLGMEHALTNAIGRYMPVEEAVWLINSCTGEAGEVEAELADWRWEHAHQLYKYKHLDDPENLLTRIAQRAFLYPALRITRELSRAFHRLRP